MKVLLRLGSFAVGLSLLLCASGASAQISPKPLDAAAKFDEYGSIGGCDHSARLDNLAIQLQNDPAIKAQVIYYGPERSGEYTQLIIRDYLINNRGIDAGRLEFIYAGPNDDLKEPRVELWVAPLEASPPALATYKNDGDTFTGLFDDSPSWDSIALGEGTGPPVPGVTLADSLNVKHLELRNESRAEHVRLNSTNTEKVHMRMELPATADELWSGLKSKLRSQVKKPLNDSTFFHKVKQKFKFCLTFLLTT